MKKRGGEGGRKRWMEGGRDGGIEREGEEGRKGGRRKGENFPAQSSPTFADLTSLSQSKRHLEQYFPRGKNPVCSSHMGLLDFGSLNISWVWKASRWQRTAESLGRRGLLLRTWQSSLLSYLKFKELDRQRSFVCWRPEPACSASHLTPSSSVSFRGGGCLLAEEAQEWYLSRTRASLGPFWSIQPHCAWNDKSASLCISFCLSVSPTPLSVCFTQTIEKEDRRLDRFPASRLWQSRLVVKQSAYFFTLWWLVIYFVFNCFPIQESKKVYKC